jgi:hypothetical protein
MNLRGLALGLGVLCVGLGGTLAWVVSRREPASVAPPSAVAVPTPDESSAKQQAIERLVAATKGTLDSHPDPQVSKVLLPSIKDGHEGKTDVSSNRVGMRDVDWAVPKPAGTVRVVLLGDSFIYGMGVQADQRVGVFLQKALAGHAGATPAPKIEVLHLGIVSWDIVSECAFLRRQLSLLAPDLVIQHIVPNDLDDTHGVRGFGEDARDAPLHPAQTDAYVSFIWGRDAGLDPQARPLLPWANDFEARARMDEAVGALSGLRAALAAQGCSYLVEVNWNNYVQVAGKNLAGKLPDDELLFLPLEHYFNPAFRLSKADEHWNPAGHEEQARLLFGAIRAHGLLPSLRLTAWPEAEQHAADTWKQGNAEAFAKGQLESRLARQNVTSSIQAGSWDANTAGEVYTGVTADGTVSPFAIVVLAGAGGTRVHLTGAALARPEMDGATLHVLVDGAEAGTQVLHSGQPFDFSAPLPPTAAGHDWLAVRLTTSDYVYDGADLRHCVSFRMQRLAIEKQARDASPPER